MLTDSSVEPGEVYYNNILRADGRKADLSLKDQLVAQVASRAQAFFVSFFTISEPFPKYFRK